MFRAMTEGSSLALSAISCTPKTGALSRIEINRHIAPLKSQRRSEMACLSDVLDHVEPGKEEAQRGWKRHGDFVGDQSMGALEFR